MSVKLGLIAVLLLVVFVGDLGIFMWIKSGNFEAITFIAALLICGTPFIFLVTLMGSYLQLVYRDKFQKYLDSQKR